MVARIAAPYSPQRYSLPLVAGATDDYGFDCATDVDLTTEAITKASVAIAPSGTGELAAVTIDLATTVATVRLTAGYARVYTLLWTFETSGGPPAGRRLEYVTELAVDPRSPYEITPDPTSTDFGAALTWTP